MILIPKNNEFINNKNKYILKQSFSQKKKYFSL